MTQPDFDAPRASWGRWCLRGQLDRRGASGEAVPLAPPDKQPTDVKLPEKPGKTIGWAIVGLGKLAIEEILPAFAECRLSRVTALVSGHPDKAQRLASVYGERHPGRFTILRALAMPVVLRPNGPAVLPARPSGPSGPG